MKSSNMKFNQNARNGPRVIKSHSILIVFVYLKNGSIYEKELY
jgi:hypothetical protein